jgi:DNA invertase Pin-like site-specific DNA recombinase
VASGRRLHRPHPHTLRERGVDLIAADNPGSFIDDTPAAKLVRQVLGAISEFDKAMTVGKLRGARERKRREAGKCEGRKSHAELRPEVVALVRQLRRRRPKGGQRSLRELNVFNAAKSLAQARDRRFNWRLVELPGVGHDARKMLSAPQASEALLP